MKKMKKMEYKQYFKPAKEDWYPCYKVDNKDCVSVSLQEDRVVVFGEDDFGMECFCKTKTDAETCFKHLATIKLIEKSYLEKLGFVQW